MTNTTDSTLTLTVEEARIYDTGGAAWGWLAHEVRERARTLSAKLGGITVEIAHPGGFVFDMVDTDVEAHEGMCPVRGI